MPKITMVDYVTRDYFSPHRIRNGMRHRSKWRRMRDGMEGCMSGWRDAIAGALYTWDAGINPEPSRSWPEQQEHDPENAMFYETFAACAHNALLSMPPADRIALARELLEGTGWVVAERRLLEAAHACMRETGWQLAPAHAARGSDGVLECACAEVVAQVGELLGDEP